MRTLERFWQWFDNERPTSEHAKRMAMENVSERGREELEHAADAIADRAGRRRHNCAIRNALALHPVALRDLSLALLRARDAMDAAVPDTWRTGTLQPSVFREVDRHEPIMLHPAQYQSLQDELEKPKDWIPRLPPTDVFHGITRSVDRTTPEEEPGLGGEPGSLGERIVMKMIAERYPEVRGLVEKHEALLRQFVDEAAKPRPRIVAYNGAEIAEAQGVTLTDAPPSTWHSTPDPEAKAYLAALGAKMDEDMANRARRLERYSLAYSGQFVADAQCARCLARGGNHADGCALKVGL